MKQLFKALMLISRQYQTSQIVFKNFPGKIDHNLRVVNMLVNHNECGINEERLLVGAALHDVLDFIPLIKPHWIKVFGAPVLELVHECTIPGDLTPTEKKQKMLDTLSTKSGMTKVILLADVCAELYEEVYIKATEGRTLNCNKAQIIEYVALIEKCMDALSGRATYLDDYARELLRDARRSFNIETCDAPPNPTTKESVISEALVRTQPYPPSERRHYTTSQREAGVRYPLRRLFKDNKV